MRAKAALATLLPVVALAALVALALTVDLQLPGEGTGQGSGRGSGTGPGSGSGSGGSGGGSGGGGSSEASRTLPCSTGQVVAIVVGLVIAGFAIVPALKREWVWAVLLVLVGALVAWLLWPNCDATPELRPADPVGSGGGGGSGQRAPPVPVIPPIALWIVAILVVAALLAALLVAWARNRRGGGASPVPAGLPEEAAPDAPAPVDAGPATPRGAVIQAYVDAATALARAGHLRHPWETAREFAARVPPGPAPAMRELTSLYELVRHGGVAPGEHTVARAQALALAVREGAAHG